MNENDKNEKSERDENVETRETRETRDTRDTRSIREDRSSTYLYVAPMPSLRLELLLANHRPKVLIPGGKYGMRCDDLLSLTFLIIHCVKSVTEISIKNIPLNRPWNHNSNNCNNNIKNNDNTNKNTKNNDNKRNKHTSNNNNYNNYNNFNSYNDDVSGVSVTTNILDLDCTLGAVSTYVCYIVLPALASALQWYVLQLLLPSTSFFVGDDCISSGCHGDESRLGDSSDGDNRNISNTKIQSERDIYEYFTDILSYIVAIIDISMTSLTPKEMVQLITMVFNNRTMERAVHVLTRYSMDQINGDRVRQASQDKQRIYENIQLSSLIFTISYTLESFTEFASETKEGSINKKAEDDKEEKVDWLLYSLVPVWSLGSLSLTLLDSIASISIEKNKLSQIITGHLGDLYSSFLSDSISARQKCTEVGCESSDRGSTFQMSLSVPSCFGIIGSGCVFLTLLLFYSILFLIYVIIY